MDWSLSIGACDWVAAGASLLLFIALFVPWVMGKLDGSTVMSGADYGWLAVISVIAVFAALALRLLRVNVGISTALVYLYFGGFAVIITALIMAIRPLTNSSGGYITGTITRYPFVGAGIGLVAGLTIFICGFLQREGRGLPADDTNAPEFPGTWAAEFVIASSALLLFVSLFLPWVSSTSAGYTIVYGAQFGWVAILGVIIAAAGLLTEFLPFDLPVPTYVIYFLAGGIALLMTALMMGIRPAPVFIENARLGVGLLAAARAVRIGPGITPYFGAYTSLLASIGILLGGYMKYLGQWTEP